MLSQINFDLEEQMNKMSEDSSIEVDAARENSSEDEEDDLWDEKGDCTAIQASDP